MNYARGIKLTLGPNLYLDCRAPPRLDLQSQQFSRSRGGGTSIGPGVVAQVLVWQWYRSESIWVEVGQARAIWLYLCTPAPLGVLTVAESQILPSLPEPAVGSHTPPQLHGGGGAKLQLHFSCHLPQVAAGAQALLRGTRGYKFRSLVL